MSVQTLNRCGVALLLSAPVPGCSFLGSDRNSTPGRLSDQCGWNRSKCLYEGAYESGESDQAEDEARRLNKAEADRLRRKNSGW